MPILCLSVLIVCACGAAAEDVPFSPTVYDSAGVEIVDNGAGTPAGVLTVRETMRLGTRDGEGPELFSEITSLAIDGDGRIIVGNNGSASVRVFDRDGSFESEFGRRGQGPAEFRMINRLIVTGDTVVVIDVQRGVKVVLFSIAGDLLDSWSVPQTDIAQSLETPVAKLPEGWLWGRISPLPRSLAPGEAYVHYSTSFLRDIDGTGPVREWASFPALTFYGASSGGVVEPLFAARLYGGFDGTGKLFLSATDAYRIDVLNGNDVVRSIRREVELLPVTEADVRDLKAERLAMFERTTTLPEALRPPQRTDIVAGYEMRVGLPVPEVHAPIVGMLVSVDGSFWVRRETGSPVVAEAERSFLSPAAVPVRSTTWDLFDRRGIFQGTVELPARYRPDIADGFTVTGIALDEYDVEYVVRYEAVR